MTFPAATRPPASGFIPAGVDAGATRRQHRRPARRSARLATLCQWPNAATRCALSQQLLAHADELAGLISSEVGKVVGRVPRRGGKIRQAVPLLRRLAPELLATQEIPTLASRSGVSFEPLGLVLAVMPWNYPVWQVLRFAVPALAAGNACLVKPAPSVPLTTERLLALVRAAGIDALDVAWIDTPQVEAAIAASMPSRSPARRHTGRRIAELAGRHIKKSVLELGGSNPCIVLADADIALAAEEAAHSRFRDAGQSCNAAKRMVLAPEIAEDFCRRFGCRPPLAVWRPARPGHHAGAAGPRRPARRPAPTSDRRPRPRRALPAGGELPDGSGFSTRPPCWIRSAPPAGWARRNLWPGGQRAARPPDLDAIRLANDTPFGLGASIYSADVERAQALAAELEVGSVFINRHTSSDLRLPFGG